MEPRIPEEPGSPSLLRPRRVGEILGDALKLYARHWQNLIVIVAVIVIPLSIAQVLIGDLWVREGFTQESSATAPRSRPGPRSASRSRDSCWRSCRS
jgi:hypothetical protein